jgi:hypothetical protein
MLSQNPSSPSWSSTTHDKARHVSDPIYASVEFMSARALIMMSTAHVVQMMHAGARNTIALRQVHSSSRNYNVGVNNPIDRLSSTHVKESWSLGSWMTRLDLWPGRCAVATIEKSSSQQIAY